jgi:hypothetical protein
MTDRLPIFATNDPARSETVAATINELFRLCRQELREAPSLAIATAYLNPAGFSLIASEVEQAPRVRLLLGAEPQWNMDAEYISSDIEKRIDLGIAQERDSTGFTLEADRTTRRLVDWLRGNGGQPNGGVEVRRLTKGFLHGKAFIVEHPLGGVISGSSNLTYAGLARNHELNLGVEDGARRDRVFEWFDENWRAAEPFDLAAFYEQRWLPHRPWAVFMRMLHELYKNDLGDDDLGERLGLRLTGFQRDGVSRALRILESLGGVLVCDEVGLGKTFIAGEIIYQSAKRDRQKVLVVCPAALRDSTWERFLEDNGLSSRVKVVSFDDLRLGNAPALQAEFRDEYALVVVDEAHNLRNLATQRARELNALVGGEFRKKVVLLTATPINNSLDDLQALVGYFVRNDAHFAELGLPSIAAYIKRAKDLDPETLSPEHLFDLLDQVAVRRTRLFIKNNYAGDLMRGPDGTEQEIEFPTPKLHRIDYEFSKTGEKVLAAVEYALSDGDADQDLATRLRQRCADPARLSMARYVPSLYAKDESIQARQVSASGLLQSAMLKRLESSMHALANTLGKMISSHRAFLRALSQGMVLSGEVLADYAFSDDDLEEFLEEYDDLNQDNCLDASLFDTAALFGRVELDAQLLEQLLVLAKQACEERDPKVAQLLDQLSKRSRESERPSPFGISAIDRRKTIVFSSYSDTAQHVWEQVVAAVNAAPAGSDLERYKNRIASPIFGSSRGIDQTARARTLARFVPKTMGIRNEAGTVITPDDFDLLICTDVLSEGVNLQQAGNIVSMDLPWNPMRLVQRHGRCDRLFSSHKFVDFGCFFPTKHLDDLLELEATLQRKVAYANAALGHGEILPGQVSDPNIEAVFQDKIAQIKEIHHGDTSIFDTRGGSAAQSGEEYRQRLQKAMADLSASDEVLGLPYGSGSGFVSTRCTRPGWVFCALIGGPAKHPRPWFRWVEADRESWTPLRNEVGQPTVRDDTLSCLIAADPIGVDEPQSLPEAAKSGVFEAWKVARQHIFERWTSLTDPASLSPALPLAVRQAAALVQEHGGHLGADVQSDLLQRLNGRWPKRIVDEIREIVRIDGAPRKKIDSLHRFVKEQSLDVPVPPKPLLPIMLDDIKLVCWMAVTPSN